MYDWLASTAQAVPRALALIVGDQAWTYRQLSALVDDWCGRLKAADVRAGKRVGLLMPNGLESICAIHALARLGAVALLFNTRLTASEIQAQVDQVGCDLLICAPELLAVPLVLLPTLTPDGLSKIAAVRFNPVHLDRDAVQSVVFTSGTTGKPKGAQITFGNLYASAQASAERLDAYPEDRWLCPLPFYHVGGLSILFRSAIYGSSFALPESTSAEAIIKALHNSQSTLVSLVPTQLYRLLEAGFKLPPSLRLILLGGAAATPELLADCLERDLPVALTYGLTECASQVATATPEQMSLKPGSVGQPLSSTMVSIVDDRGNTLPAGEYGEIVVSGATVMKGYLGQPPTGGTFYTGDIGCLDADGDLWVVQRRSDLIVSGGENVYPSEVEAVLRRHPAVADACVVGLPDAEWGQRVAAMVALRGGASLAEAELIAFARDRLAGYKQPRRIVFVDDLPQTASGKVQRANVREQIEAM